MTSLQRAGWGALSGNTWQGVRSTLHALVSQLPHRSGQGNVTANQIADSAGLSSRWVRRCLIVLEELEIISWDRGGVISGSPKPSFIRIHKTALVELIRQARPQLTDALKKRREATARRLAGLRFVKGKPRKFNGFAHAELNASPISSNDGGTTPERVGGAYPAIGDTEMRRRNQPKQTMSQWLAANPRIAHYLDHLTKKYNGSCPHGWHTGAVNCPSCRNSAIRWDREGKLTPPSHQQEALL